MTPLDGKAHVSPQFPLLSSPVTIGPLRLRNRVILLPHGVAYAEPGEYLPTPRHVEYYGARAQGGAGMVCVETLVVSPDGMCTPPLVLISDPDAVAGCRAIADAVHEAGSLVAGQLSHFGNQADISVTRRPMLGPSNLPDPAVGQQPLALNRAQMDRILEDFVAGARNLRAAGFDCVEIKVGHDGLLRQFLSPLTNDRTDEYGGSVANRLRYPLEVARAVREAIGPDVALAARLTLDERFPGGYGLDEGIGFARELAASGLFGHITPSVGVWASADQIVPPMTTPEGFAEEAFTRAARESGLPVVATGVIRTPEYAERMLSETDVVAIGMARELIADPDWANKVSEGAAASIRPCTGCNQLCMGNIRNRLPVSCTVNPYAGYGERRPGVVADSGRVVVVGGGPAGMEAARTAAEDGFEVVLLEREERLGGQLALAAETGRRVEWKRYLEWLGGELERLGVEVHLSSSATVEGIRELDPATVVVACGSEPSIPSLPGEFTTVDEFLAAPAFEGRVALTQMGLAGFPLWTAALEASLRGAAAVALVTPAPSVAWDIENTTFLDLFRDLSRRGVAFYPDHTVTARGDATLRVSNIYTEVDTELAADVVVASTPRRSRGSELVEALGVEAGVQVIGDALLPRDLAAAVREGQDAMRERSQQR